MRLRRVVLALTPRAVPPAAPPAVVRAARPDDLAAVAAVDAACFGAHAYPDFLFRQALDAFGGGLRVAEGPDGAPAGYTLAVRAAGDDAGWILSMGVGPAHRGRGLGAALLEDAVGALAARGAREVRLTVDPANATAAALYARSGFRVVAEEAAYFGPGERRVVMARAAGA